VLRTGATGSTATQPTVSRGEEQTAETLHELKKMPIHDKGTTKFIDMPIRGVHTSKENDMFAKKIQAAKARRAGMESCPIPVSRRDQHAHGSVIAEKLCDAFGAMLKSSTLPLLPALGSQITECEEVPRNSRCVRRETFNGESRAEGQHGRQ